MLLQIPSDWIISFIETPVRRVSGTRRTQGTEKQTLNHFNVCQILFLIMSLKK